MQSNVIKKFFPFNSSISFQQRQFAFQIPSEFVQSADVCESPYQNKNISDLELAAAALSIF